MRRARECIAANEGALAALEPLAARQPFAAPSPEAPARAGRQIAVPTIPARRVRDLMGQHGCIWNGRPGRRGRSTPRSRFAAAESASDWEAFSALWRCVVGKAVAEMPSEQP